VTSLTAIGSAARVDGVDIDAAIQALQAVGVRDFFAGLLPQASFAPGVDPALIERALVAADRDPDTVIAVTRTALTADHTDDASAVTCPALVITGELDQTTPVPLGAELAKLLNTEHVVVDNRGHVLPMEDPTALVALLAKHFDAAEHR
jgi:pimeloyl-ACP methyl ester carboxylesterase